MSTPISRNWNLQSEKHVADESNLESGKQEAGNEKVKDVNKGITGRATIPVGAAHAEMEDIRKTGKQETERRTSNTGITGGTTASVGAVLRRAEDCPPYLICKR